MKTKLLITAILLFTFATAIIAQDKYEFAIVRSSYTVQGVADGLEISISGKPTQKIKFEKGEIKDNDAIQLFLNYISEMSAQGWEVINVNNGWFLKRKASKEK